MYLSKDTYNCIGSNSTRLNDDTSAEPSLASSRITTRTTPTGTARHAPNHALGSKEEDPPNRTPSPYSQTSPGNSPPTSPALTPRTYK